MRALLTGGSGFVGGHLSAYLEAEGDDVASLPLSIDVADAAAVRAFVVACRPQAVYHLAGRASVAESWADPVGVMTTNVVGTASVIAAAQACDPPPRVLVVSSADAYGAFAPADLPLRESTPLRPVSPYGASKAAAEVVALQAERGTGLGVVVARSFNHTGPGQATTFAVPGFAARIAAAAAAGDTTMAVGNLSARRDLLDVADVVRAYRLLVRAGQSGRAYNVCSGRDVAMQEVVDGLVELVGADIDLDVDPALLRPVDTPVLRGDNSALRALGWAPTVPLEHTLAAVLAHEREAVAAR